jgi:DNA-binding CsgD family transcriptional regulator
VIKEQWKQSISLSNWENIWMYLSEKQNKVWNYIVENHPCSRKAIVEWIWISEWTVKQAISKLIMMWKIIRIWETRWIQYNIK